MTNPAPKTAELEPGEYKTPQHLLPLNYDGTETRAVVFGKLCLGCGGPIFVPKRGKPGVTCSDTCRQRLHRMKRE